MPFPFRYICDLLQTLEDETLSKKKQKKPAEVFVEEWFSKHRELVDAPSTDGAALLSTLLSARRPDRVYGIQQSKLEGIIGRAMRLGNSRLLQLRQYNISGLDKDLADCVEGLLTQTVSYFFFRKRRSLFCWSQAQACFHTLVLMDFPAKRPASRGNHSGGNR